LRHLEVCMCVTKYAYLCLQVTLKLEESQLPDVDQLTQYHVKCTEADKFLLLFTLLKLRLVRGKTIIFVNDIDRCYR
jgi:ATP-dependent RNA helicase DDX56/DBP9